MSFTPEALYNIRSCDEQDNKKIFMSSPACADGYDIVPGLLELESHAVPGRGTAFTIF